MLRARGQMILTKTNMQSNYDDNICKQNIGETQKHILQECTETGKITEQLEDYDNTPTLMNFSQELGFQL